MKSFENNDRISYEYKYEYKIIVRQISSVLIVLLLEMKTVSVGLVFRIIIILL